MTNEFKTIAPKWNKKDGQKKHSHLHNVRMFNTGIDFATQLIKCNLIINHLKNG